MGFNDAVVLWSHCKLHSLRILQCPTCNFGFQSQAMLESHQQKHLKVNDIITVIPQNADPSHSALQKAIQSYEAERMRQHIIDRSGNAASDDKLLIEESFLLNDAQVNSSQKFVCHLCGEAFATPVDWKVHWNGKCNMKMQSFICNTCNKFFKNETSFQNHVKLHQVALKQATSSLKSASSVKRHLAQSGSNSSTESSRFSKKPLGKLPRKTWQQYLDHRNRLDVKSYIKGANQDKSNVKVGLGEKDREGTRALVGDIADPKLVTVYGKNAYSCKLCSKLTFSRCHHEEHFRLHTGEMPHDCEFCGKRFKQRSGWNRHVKLHHKYDIYSGPVPTSSQAKKLASKSDSKPNQTQVPIAPAPVFLHPTSSTQSTESTQQNMVYMMVDGNKIVYVPSSTFPPPNVIGTAPLLSPTVTGDATQAMAASPHNIVVALQSPDQSQQLGSPLQTIPTLQTPGTPATVSGGNTTMLLNGETSPPNVFTEPLIQIPAPISIVNAKNDKPKVEFQIKNVNAINGEGMTIIKRSGGPGRDDGFAYVIDKDGNVTARFCIGAETDDDWTDMSMNREYVDNLIRSIKMYDDLHRRGRKIVDCSAEIQERVQAVESMQREKGITPPKVAPVDDALNTQKGLSSYGRTFKSGKEKRFECSICQKKFLAQAHVNEHMKIHTGEFPYKCMFCKRPFRHKSGMNSHHKRHIQRGIFDRPITNRPETHIIEHELAQLANQQLAEENAAAGVSMKRKLVENEDESDQAEKIFISAASSEISINVQDELPSLSILPPEPAGPFEFDLTRVKIEADDLSDDVDKWTVFGSTVTCMYCPEMFASRSSFLNHLEEKHNQPCMIDEETSTSKCKTAIADIVCKESVNSSNSAVSQLSSSSVQMAEVDGETITIKQEVKQEEDL